MVSWFSGTCANCWYSYITAGLEYGKISRGKINKKLNQREKSRNQGNYNEYLLFYIYRNYSTSAQLFRFSDCSLRQDQDHSRLYVDILCWMNWTSDWVFIVRITPETGRKRIEKCSRILSATMQHGAHVEKTCSTTVCRFNLHKSSSHPRTLQKGHSDDFILCHR